MSAAASPAGMRARRPEREERRSHQPVRRDSRLDGAWVGDFIRPMTWREKHELCNAARRYDRANKAPGERNGPIGSIGLELLEELASMAVSFAGRVYPSLVHLAGRIGRSKATVVRYLKRLGEAGLLAWVRRIVPKEGAGWARGPQVEQASNIYRLGLPARLRGFVRRPPPAADEVARKAEIQARIDAFQRAEAAEGIDAAIARGLAAGAARNAAARASSERESRRRSETDPQLFSKAST